MFHSALNCQTSIYLQTPWRGVNLERVTVLQLARKFPAFHETQEFITVFTTARYLSVSSTRWTQPTLRFSHTIHFNIIIQFRYTSSKRSISYSFSFLCCSILSYSCHMLLLSSLMELCLSFDTGLLDLDAGRLARSQNPEGPATGHLDTGFLRFPVS
jgi:hypothetical protein